MIEFMRFRWLYFLISLIVIGLGLFSIVKWGYQYSIDFTGGSVLIYRFNQPVDQKKVTQFLNQQLKGVKSIQFNNNQVLIKALPLAQTEEKKFKTAFEKQFRLKIELLRFETVGPVIGRETINKTLIASFFAIVGILIYMSFAFKGINYALSAIIALIHDFLVVVGSYSLLSKFFQAEFDTLFVTALLTTMSFSVHDTIVIFDKIREYIQDKGRGNLIYYANLALTETMVRSLNNSMTIIFMLLALILLGGQSIRFFVLTLLIGTITGTYSSPFVATPVLVYLEKKNR